MQVNRGATAEDPVAAEVSDRLGRGSRLQAVARDDDRHQEIASTEHAVARSGSTVTTMCRRRARRDMPATLEKVAALYEAATRRCHRRRGGAQAVPRPRARGDRPQGREQRPLRGRQVGVRRGCVREGRAGCLAALSDPLTQRDPAPMRKLC